MLLTNPPFCCECHNLVVSLYLNLNTDTMNTVQIYVTVVLLLFIIGGIIDKFYIPTLNPDNRFVKWWRKHIIDDDPFEK